MNKFVIDSWAWVEYLNGTERGFEVKKIIESGNKLFTSIISLAEVISVAKRKNMDIDVVENAVVSNSEIVEIDKQIVREVGIFHGEMKRKIDDFGLGDAFVVIAARSLEAKILTGDPHFRKIREAVMI